MGKAYLFRIRLWVDDPPEFILVYSENEDNARIKCAKKIRYNSGKQVKPNDLQLATIF